MSNPVLNESDLISTTWLKIKRHYEARLHELRAKNDSISTPEKTAWLRGEIAEVKRILDLGVEPEIIEED